MTQLTEQIEKRLRDMSPLLEWSVLKMDDLPTLDRFEVRVSVEIDGRRFATAWPFTIKEYHYFENLDHFAGRTRAVLIRELVEFLVDEAR